MLEAAPPAWGWTLATFASYIEAKGCPACVGMDTEEFPHDPLVFGSVSTATASEIRRNSQTLYGVP